MFEDGDLRAERAPADVLEFAAFGRRNEAGALVGMTDRLESRLDWLCIRKEEITVFYWLIGVYSLMLIMLIATSASVALFAKDHTRGARASVVLKMLIVAGGSGIIAVVACLHQGGQQ